KECTQESRLYGLIRNDNCIAGIHRKPVEPITPGTFRHRVAYNFSVCPDNERMSSIGVLIGASGQTKVGVHTQSARIEKGVLIVYRAHHIHRRWNWRNDKNVAIFQGYVR